MPRLTFEQIRREAQKRALILEQITRTIDCETYRYEITDNQSGITAECQTLEEAWSEIYYWSVANHED